MDTIEVGDYARLKTDFRISASSHLHILQAQGAIGRVIPNYNGNIDRIFVRFQYRDVVIKHEVDGMFQADELELVDIATLSSAAPAGTSSTGWRWIDDAIASEESELERLRREYNDVKHRLETAIVALRRIHELPKSGDVLDDAAEMQATAYLTLLAVGALNAPATALLAQPEDA